MYILDYTVLDILDIYWVFVLEIYIIAVPYKL